MKNNTGREETGPSGDVKSIPPWDSTTLVEDEQYPAVEKKAPWKQDVNELESTFRSEER